MSERESVRAARRCSACGRVGERGFWTQVRMHPEPNRTLCTNHDACEKRQRKRANRVVEENLVLREAWLRQQGEA